MSRFLVTGASGYIALHVVDQLLKEGHFVRGTVRSVKDEKKTEPIRNLANNTKGKLELVEADLMDANSWTKAVENIDYILHVASPFPLATPKTEDEVIKPAVEGTLNVLNAALGTSVKRVIVTSSGLTVFGYDWEDKTYSEKDWADPEKMSFAYGKSKVLAEKAVWNFVEERKKKNLPCFEVAVVHPVLVLGPVLSPITGTSAAYFLNVLKNKDGKTPGNNYPVCDVRDVASAHIRAAFNSDAVGHRHLIVSLPDMVPMKKWAEILKEEFEPKGFTISTESEPVKEKGSNAKIDDTRMRKVLGITPIDFKKTLIDMANSFIEHGLVTP